MGLDRICRDNENLRRARRGLLENYRLSSDPAGALNRKCLRWDREPAMLPANGRALEISLDAQNNPDLMSIIAEHSAAGRVA
jgi:hypothetical protein